MPLPAYLRRHTGAMTCICPGCWGANAARGAGATIQNGKNAAKREHRLAGGCDTLGPCEEHRRG